MKVLAAGVLLLAFLAGALLLLRYCLQTRRPRLRVFLGSWFLVLTGLLLRFSWIKFTVERPHESLAEGLAALDLGVTRLFGAVFFCGLALAYFAPTIWRTLQQRYVSSHSGGSRASRSPSAIGSVPFGRIESLLATFIMLVLAGLNWQVLVSAFPVLIYHAQSNQPLPWLRIKTNSKAAEAGPRALTWTETSVYIESPAGWWSPISFPTESPSRHLSILSPDAVLITWPTSAGAIYSTVTGALYLKGSPDPVATIPPSDDIAAIPSGGFTAVRCEPHPLCEAEFCLRCASFTIERYDVRGMLVTSDKLPLGNDPRPCNWWPVHRLMNADFVYSVYDCPSGSTYLAGYYRVSPAGVQRITSRQVSNEYTAVADKNEMESQTRPAAWYHIPWIPDSL